MTIVFDEILSEVHTPTTNRSAGENGPREGQAQGDTTAQDELQRTLERINIRQLRLMAD